MAKSDESLERNLCDEITADLNAIIKNASLRVEQLLLRQEVNPGELDHLAEWFAKERAFHVLDALVSGGLTVRVPNQIAMGPLWYASIAISYRRFIKLLDLGGDINEPSFDDPPDQIPMTPRDTVHTEHHCVRSPAEHDAVDALYEFIEAHGGKWGSDLYGSGE